MERAGSEQVGMSREQALEMVTANVKNRNLVKHMLAVEGVMRALARRLGRDEHTWATAGLLHDVDYDQTSKDPNRHSLVGGEMLEKAGLPADVVHAVKAHNEVHGIPRESMLDRALFATDPLTGLIVAAALIHPQKRLEPIDVQFVLNRFKEQGFARGANREHIQTCSELGLTLAEFVEIGLGAMKGCAADLGL